MKNGLKRALASMLVAVMLLALTANLVVSNAQTDASLTKIYDMLSQNMTEPKTAEEYMERAKIEIGQEEYDKALKDLNQVITNAGSEQADLREEAKLKKAAIYILQGNNQKAKELLDDMKTSASALQLLIQIDLQENDYSNAAKHMKTYTELVPDDATYQEALAQVYEAQEKYSESAAAYEKLYASYPEEDAYLLNQLRCLFLNSEYETALAGFESYLAKPIGEELSEEDKAKKQTYRGLAAFLGAACYMQMNKLDEAIAEYNVAVQEGYDAAACYEQMVISAFEKEDYEATLQYVAEIEEKGLEVSTPALLMQEKGAALMNLQRYDEAITALDDSISLDDTLIATYYYRGMTLLSLEKYEDAINDFTTAINQNYLTDYCYYNRGVSYVGAKDYSAAVEDFGVVLQGTDDTLISAAREILWALAEYYEQQNAGETK